MNIKGTLLRAHSLLSSQFGIDFSRFFRALRALPVFLRELVRFRRAYKGKLALFPFLHDRYTEGGETKGEYFWQDLVVARWVHAAAPEKHVDIGSSVGGFVAHIASFREIEVFDVRPITTEIPGVVFRQADLMDASSLPSSNGSYTDSLSCLHALEHFGLGRYGDPINPQGYRFGIQNMAKLLRPGGVFYLSTPIGEERVDFNANWIFDPRTLIRIALENNLALKRLTVFSCTYGINDITQSDANLTKLSKEKYNLGIFKFIKSEQAN